MHNKHLKEKHKN